MRVWKLLGSKMKKLRGDCNTWTQKGLFDVSHIQNSICFYILAFIFFNHFICMKYNNILNAGRISEAVHPGHFKFRISLLLRTKSTWLINSLTTLVHVSTGVERLWGDRGLWETQAIEKEDPNGGDIGSLQQQEDSQVLTEAELSGWRWPPQQQQSGQIQTGPGETPNVQLSILYILYISIGIQFYVYLYTHSPLLN